MLEIILRIMYFARLVFIASFRYQNCFFSRKSRSMLISFSLFLNVNFRKKMPILTNANPVTTSTRIVKYPSQLEKYSIKTLVDGLMIVNQVQEAIIVRIASQIAFLYAYHVCFCMYPRYVPSTPSAITGNHPSAFRIQYAGLKYRHKNIISSAAFLKYTFAI